MHVSINLSLSHETVAAALASAEPGPPPWLWFLFLALTPTMTLRLVCGSSQLGPARRLLAGPFEKKGGKYIAPPKFYREQIDTMKTMA